MKHSGAPLFARPTNIRLGWRGLLGTNTLAYWAHPYATEKIKFSEYDSSRADPQTLG
jgi:hypothetical protein